jgi:hypothetical protein
LGGQWLDREHNIGAQKLFTLIARWKDFCASAREILIVSPSVKARSRFNRYNEPCAREFGDDVRKKCNALLAGFTLGHHNNAHIESLSLGLCSGYL